MGERGIEDRQMRWGRQRKGFFYNTFDWLFLTPHFEKGIKQGFAQDKFPEPLFCRACVFSTLWKLNPSKVSKSKLWKGLAFLKQSAEPQRSVPWPLPSHFALWCPAESSHCPSPEPPMPLPKCCNIQSSLWKWSHSNSRELGTAIWLPLVSLSHSAPEWIKASTKVESI